MESMLIPLGALKVLATVTLILAILSLILSFMPTPESNAKPSYWVMTWDWKDSPCLEFAAELLGWVAEDHGGSTALYVDTQSDQYAVVIGPATMTRAQAQEYYEVYCDSDDDQQARVLARRALG